MYIYYGDPANDEHVLENTTPISSLSFNLIDFNKAQ